MKEHVQKPGVRKWAGEDLIELQGESLTAIQSLVEPYAPCIVQGCEVSYADGVYHVQPGIVALKGSNEDGNDCTKIVRFAGYTGEVLPIYLTINVTPYMRVYADEENKPIAYEYTAEPDTNQPDVPYLKIDVDGGERLVDTIGITRKLDREGGDASNVKVAFSTSAARSNITTGSTLKEAFGRIARWFSDLKTLAFKDKVSKTDLDTSLTNDFDNKVDKVSGKGLSTNDFTTALKDKLDKIEPGANNYTHPTGSGNNHIPAGGSSGQYLKYSSAGTAAWATPSSNVASSSAAGFMSATDKSKLDGIAEGANKITVDTALSSTSTNPVQNKVVNTALAGKSDSGHTHSAATTSAAGFMSSTDKSNLNALAENLRIIYACKFTVSTSGTIAKTYEKAVSGVTVSLTKGTKDSGGNFVQVQASGFSGRVLPVITGQSTGMAWFDGDTTYGSLKIRQYNNNGDSLLGGGATFVLIKIG